MAKPFQKNDSQGKFMRVQALGTQTPRVEIPLKSDGVSSLATSTSKEPVRSTDIVSELLDFKRYHLCVKKQQALARSGDSTSLTEHLSKIQGVQQRAGNTTKGSKKDKLLTENRVTKKSGTNRGGRDEERTKKTKLQTMSITRKVERSASSGDREKDKSSKKVKTARTHFKKARSTRSKSRRTKSRYSKKTKSLNEEEISRSGSLSDDDSSSSNSAPNQPITVGKTSYGSSRNERVRVLNSLNRIFQSMPHKPTPRVVRRKR